MVPDPQDTIVALSSAPGPGARAIVRLSGPAASQCAATLFTPMVETLPDVKKRRQHGPVPGGGIVVRDEVVLAVSAVSSV